MLACMQLGLPVVAATMLLKALHNIKWTWSFDRLPLQHLWMDPRLSPRPLCITLHMASAQ